MMDVLQFLSPQNTLINVRASDGARLIEDLARHAGASLGLDAKLIAQALMNREALGSTGMGAGIALPHARLPEIKKPFGVLARLKRPIDFDAIDARPVDLAFLLLLPAVETAQLNALAAVARKLREPDRLERMRRADDATELFREFTQ